MTAAWTRIVTKLHTGRFPFFLIQYQSIEKTFRHDPWQQPTGDVWTLATFIHEPSLAF